MTRSKPENRILFPWQRRKGHTSTWKHFVPLTGRTSSCRQSDAASKSSSPWRLACPHPRFINLNLDQLSSLNHIHSTFWFVVQCEHWSFCHRQVCKQVITMATGVCLLAWSQQRSGVSFSVSSHHTDKQQQQQKVKIKAEAFPLCWADRQAGRQTGGSTAQTLFWWHYLHPSVTAAVYKISAMNGFYGGRWVEPLPSQRISDEKQNERRFPSIRSAETRPGLRVLQDVCRSSYPIRASL